MTVARPRSLRTNERQLQQSPLIDLLSLRGLRRRRRRRFLRSFSTRPGESCGGTFPAFSAAPGSAPLSPGISAWNSAGKRRELTAGKGECSRLRPRKTGSFYSAAVGSVSLATSKSNCFGVSAGHQKGVIVGCGAEAEVRAFRIRFCRSMGVPDEIGRELPVSAYRVLT